MFEIKCLSTTKQRFLLELIGVLFVLNIFITLSSAESCDPKIAPTYSLANEHFHLEISGLQIRLYAIDPSTTTVIRDHFLSFTTQSIDQAKYPLGYYNREPAEVRNRFLNDGLNLTCTPSYENKTIDGGIVRSVIQTVHFDAPGFTEDTKVVFTFALYPVVGEINLYNNSIKVDPKSVKFTYEIFNWTWGDAAEPNRHQWYLRTNTINKLEAPLSEINQWDGQTEDQYHTYLNLSTTYISTYMIFDRFYFHDGKFKFIDYISNSLFVAEDQSFLGYQLLSGFSRVGHPSYIIYDPSFSVLFDTSAPFNAPTTDSPSTLLNPTSPESAVVSPTGDNSGAIAGGIVGAFLIATVIFIILVIKIKRLRTVLAPFSRRERETVHGMPPPTQTQHVNTDDSQKRDSSWVKSNKPRETKNVQ